MGMGVCLTPISVSASPSTFNQYTFVQRDSIGVYSRVAQLSQTWQSIFGSRANLARQYNRQNVQLEPGQYYMIPPNNSSMESLSPFPSRWQTDESYLVVINPVDYAWALYVKGRQIRWGSAVCGGSWCSDVARSCQTPTGYFTVSEVAGPHRRSSSYPIIEAAEGRGALMPYYMRLTSRGVGMHARYIKGSHETHGCIGLFYQDAQWLNLEVARHHKLNVVVLSYA